MSAFKKLPQSFATIRECVLEHERKKHNGKPCGTIRLRVLATVVAQLGIPAEAFRDEEFCADLEQALADFEALQSEFVL